MKAMLTHMPEGKLLPAHTVVKFDDDYFILELYGNIHTGDLMMRIEDFGLSELSRSGRYWSKERSERIYKVVWTTAKYKNIEEMNIKWESIIKQND